MTDYLAPQPHIAGIHRYYDGTDGRQLVRCPTCYRPADAQFGDHGDDAGCQMLGEETRELRAWLAKKRRNRLA